MGVEKKLDPFLEAIDAVTGGGIRSGAIEVISYESNIFADVQRAMIVANHVATYSKDYCINTLGVSPAEYDASVGRGAIEFADRQRRDRAEVGWLMTQVVGAEE